MKPLILCADDYGMTAGVSAAIRTLVTEGRLNAVSVMMPPPASGAETAALRSAVEAAPVPVSIGLHLTLTGPFRPLDAQFAPKAGEHFTSLPALMGAAYAGRLKRPRMEAEILAQIAAFKRAFGHPPAFIDGHQHVQLLPTIRDGLIHVATAEAPSAWLRQCGGAGRPAAMLLNPKIAVMESLSRAFRGRALAAGRSTNPAFSGSYVFSPKARFSALFPRFLTGLPAGSVVMCHPGHVDDTLKRLDPVTDLRQHEFDYLSSARFPRDLAAAGFTLQR